MVGQTIAHYRVTARLGAGGMGEVPLPPSGAKWQISAAGGRLPIRRGDGKELLYLVPDVRLMAAPIQPGSAIEPGAPKALFETRTPPVGTVSRVYDVAPDGRRFPVNTLLQQAEQTPITVVVNWRQAAGR